MNVIGVVLEVNGDDAEQEAVKFEKCAPHILPHLNPAYGPVVMEANYCPDGCHILGVRATQKVNVIYVAPGGVVECVREITEETIIVFDEPVAV